MERSLTVAVLPTRRFDLEWEETEGAPAKGTALLEREIHEHFRSRSGTWLLFLGFCDEAAPLSPSLGWLRDFAAAFTRRLIQTPDLEVLRERMEVPLVEEESARFLEQAPPMAGAEYLDADLLGGAWNELNEAFRRAIRGHDGPVEELIHGYRPEARLVGRVFFHLVENPKADQPFAFLATYSTRLDQRGRSRHVPLRHALVQYGREGEKLLELLATVQAAARRSALVAALLESGELFQPLAWPPEEAFAFLKEVPLYEDCGILCRIPNWWKAGAARVRLSVRIGESAPSFVGMDALLSFSPQLLVGDEPISEAEARALLAESEGLALIKNRWVAVDRQRLQETLEALERVKQTLGEGGLSLRDALRLELDPAGALGAAAGDGGAEATSGEWLKSVMERMRSPERAPEARPGAGFRAQLREYQKKGLAWLCLLHSYRFGACLADDMGLGKTVQLLAFLSVLREAPASSARAASLLVIPASLISNWTAEIDRFYPDLRCFVAHPDLQPGRAVEAPGAEEMGRLDLVITTYSLVQRYGWLADYTWSYVILDEAQAVKNPATSQARAVKKLRCANRIVMTGTPVENRLSDLWSIFDFLNPGLLGSRKEFSGFARTLSGDPRGYARLRRVVMPYILRRLKTDRTVITDLPEKVELKSYAPLSRKQIVLYEEVVRDFEETIGRSEGMQRRGLILALLMKLKQLCNHPDQYLGSGGYEEGESGKFGRLREICETIREKRERALVFTQFREITGALSGFLAGVFGREGLVLHGGVPVGKRKQAIDRFQGEEYVPFMVLSLKAGGVGLNLTEASHVVHFDRWWNPAVENQATDRVFRIGQRRNVMVHKLITRGSVEEKIDALLEQKARLFEQVVAGGGEGWITEMGDGELRELVRLTL